MNIISAEQLGHNGAAPTKLFSFLGNEHSFSDESAFLFSSAFRSNLDSGCFTERCFCFWGLEVALFEVADALLLSLAEGLGRKKPTEVSHNFGCLRIRRYLGNICHTKLRTYIFNQVQLSEFSESLFFKELVLQIKRKKPTNLHEVLADSLVLNIPRHRTQMAETYSLNAKNEGHTASIFSVPIDAWLPWILVPVDACANLFKNTAIYHSV